jgi:DNA-binding response OmpR family regulator
MLAGVIHANQQSEQLQTLYQEVMRQIRLMTPGAGAENEAMLHATPTESALIPLRPDLAVDLVHGEVRRGPTTIPLTGREMRVLSRLLRHPRRYLSATLLAEGIVHEEAFDPTHCIEETIRKLRRKFGEARGHPQLLRCRREVGYGIFPEPVPQNLDPPPDNAAA